MMLDLKQIMQKNPVDEKVVKIASWGGEVKIRPLSIKERNDVVSVLQDGLDEKSMAIDKVVKAQILTAHYALNEPKLSISEIESLPESAFKGIKEICDEVEKLNAKK